MNAFANTSTLTFLQTYRGENIRIVDNKYQPRIGETVEFIYDPNSGAEAMRIGYDLLRQGKCVAFVSTEAVMARTLVEKASKLSKPDNSPVKARAYYGNMDGKQKQKDFSNIDVAWDELDCVAYTNTVEAGISFEVTGHFDIIIAITNIATPVHVEAFAQMLYQIRDCPCRIISDSNAISYKIDESPAVITFVEVEYQKRLSARYFIEKLCNLIASTDASLQLIKMDESQGVIGNRKKVRNEVRDEALVIKKTDFDAVTTSQNLDSEEAKNLKFDQERSIPDTMALKCFYMRNIYGKDIDNEIWDNFCNKKKQGYDEESAMKGYKVINAIARNWCGYTVKINRKKIGLKEKQVWERSYQINRQPYDGLGFGDKGVPELPLYRSKTDNDIQELFDSIRQNK
ncbi:hypothetical protein GLOIN_2v1790944 [Rhizophagus clarus]|uniref:Uncharacterized protein n=1 Tax=Rhizophagus clarus TaxID=94130 RepID=A0A8H3KRY2_9GLOM|nr:hypothetical protein GLOIN_2v1790944 [Rhizophagus clarus]